MAPREDLIKNAVSFLRDPQVANATLAKKVEFLQSKELTQEEIDEALKRCREEPSQNREVAGSSSRETVSNTSSTPQYPQPHYYTPAPPPVPERDWKDYFIMATATVGVGYALYEITKRYLLPGIIPASKTKLEQDKEAIEQEFLRIEATLNDMNETNKQLKENEVEKAKQISKMIEEVEEVVENTKKKNSKVEDDIKFLKSEIENLKNSFERSIDKQQLSISTEVAGIQLELKSLQQLIKNKNALSKELNGAGSPIPPVSSIPSAKDILKRTNLNSTGNTNIISSQASTSASSSLSPEVNIPAWQRDSTSLDSASRNSIPSWQQTGSLSAGSSAGNSLGINASSFKSSSTNSWKQPQLSSNQTNSAIPYWQSGFVNTDEDDEPEVKSVETVETIAPSVTSVEAAASSPSLTEPQSKDTAVEVKTESTESTSDDQAQSDEEVEEKIVEIPNGPLPGYVQRETVEIPKDQKFTVVN